MFLMIFLYTYAKCFPNEAHWPLLRVSVKQVYGPTATAEELEAEQARWPESGSANVIDSRLRLDLGEYSSMIFDVASP